MLTKVLCLVLLSSALVLAVPVQEKEFDVTTIIDDVVTTVVPVVEDEIKKEDEPVVVPVVTEGPKTWYEKASGKIKEVGQNAVNKVKDTYGKVVDSISGKKTTTVKPAAADDEHTEAPKVEEGSQKNWWQKFVDGVSSTYDSAIDKVKSVFGSKKQA